MGFFAIPAAGAGFFLSAWLTMVFWGMITPELGIPTIGYVKAMLVTIAVWLVVAPLAAAVSKREGGIRWYFWR
ncbi:MAG: hypothetical protein Q8O40_02140 [Chloroflexota bacterium]|nr:hypothetical protein [Chloroflexota bacterium]